MSRAKGETVNGLKRDVELCEENKREIDRKRSLRSFNNDSAFDQSSRFNDSSFISSRATSSRRILGSLSDDSLRYLQTEFDSLSDELKEELERCDDRIHSLQNVIPSIYSKSVELGEALGQGEFGVVYEVSRFIRPRRGFFSRRSPSQRTVEIMKKKGFDNQLDSSTTNDAIEKLNLDHANGKKFVVKVLVPTESPRNLVFKMKTFTREAAVLSSLSHPNIVGVHAIAKTTSLGNSFFIVIDALSSMLTEKIMQWEYDVRKLERCFASRYRKRGQLNKLWLERVKIALNIVEALQHLHQHNVIYRDLKPDNVGFNNEKVLKLFDFGLAKMVDPRTMQDGLYLMTGCTGSKRYMAPEVYYGTLYNEKCDIYSFGILLWFILRLKQPFDKYTPEMFENLVMKEGYRPKPSENWPEEWKELLRKCYKEDYNMRYSSGELVYVLNTIVETLERGKNKMAPKVGE